MRGKAYIVRISEETDTSNYTCANVIPSERSFVDLSECESSTLIGILNMGEIIIEIVEGGVSTRGRGWDSGSHCRELRLSRLMSRLNLAEDVQSRIDGLERTVGVPGSHWGEKNRSRGRRKGYYIHC